MSGSFFSDLNLPKPDIHLGAGSASHAVQTAEIMKKFEEVLLGEKPDVVVVVGDVNSTLACALVASKIYFDSAGSRPVIAHVEAGLRSFDRSMPEEINRILTDHASDLLFVTEESGLQNLRNEGVSPIAGLEELATDCPVVFPVHPRTQQRIREFGFEFSLGGSAGKHKENVEGSGNWRDGIIPSDPLGYLDFLCLMKHATLVVTDSAGIQEETTILGIPCVTVRENTERPITVESGTNTIAGTKTGTIKDAIRRQLDRKRNDGVPKNWDGRAGARIIDILVRRHYEKTSSPPAPILHTVPLEDRYVCP